MIPDQISSGEGQPFVEYPVVFPAGQEHIFGIMAEPPHPGDCAVLLLMGASYIPMTHRGRLWVRLARQLAADGLRVLRFDYHGVGESTGEVSEFSLDRPFVEDLEGAVRWLRDRGVARLVLVGSCFGARTLLAGAGGISELVGAVLISPPVGGHRLGEHTAARFAREWSVLDYFRNALRRRVLRRVLDPDWRAVYAGIAKVKLRALLSKAFPSVHAGDGVGLDLVSPAFLHGVQRLAARRVPVLFLYGHNEELYEEFQRAMERDLGDILRSAAETVEVRVLDGVLHSFSTVRGQEDALREIMAWIRQVVGGTPMHSDRLAVSSSEALSSGRTS